MTEQAVAASTSGLGKLRLVVSDITKLKKTVEESSKRKGCGLFGGEQVTYFSQGPVVVGHPPEDS